MSEQEHKDIFEQWLQQHQALLFKVVRAYAVQKADQDDLFQEVCLQVWRSVPRVKRCLGGYNLAVSDSLAYGHNLEKEGATARKTKHSLCPGNTFARNAAIKECSIGMVVLGNHPIG